MNDSNKHHIDIAHYFITLGLRQSIAHYGDIDKCLKKAGFERNKEIEPRSRLTFVQRIASHTIIPDTKHFNRGTFALRYTQPNESSAENWIHFHNLKLTNLEKPEFLDDLTQGARRMQFILGNDLRISSTTELKYCTFDALFHIVLDKTRDYSQQLEAAINQADWIAQLGGTQIDRSMDGTRISGPVRRFDYEYHSDISLVSNPQELTLAEVTLYYKSNPSIHFHFDISNICFAPQAFEACRKEALRTLDVILQDTK